MKELRGMYCYYHGSPGKVVEASDDGSCLIHFFADTGPDPMPDSFEYFTREDIARENDEGMKVFLFFQTEEQLKAFLVWHNTEPGKSKIVAFHRGSKDKE